MKKWPFTIVQMLIATYSIYYFVNRAVANNVSRYLPFIKSSGREKYIVVKTKDGQTKRFIKYERQGGLPNFFFETAEVFYKIT